MMEDLPMTIRAIVDQATVVPITVGMSADAVYRIEADEPYYLKIGRSLTAEYDRLQWLEGKLPIPQVIHFENHQGRHYLLTRAIKGQMLFTLDLPMERLLAMVAEAAHMWHGLSIDNCPFKWGIQAQIESARHELDAGRVNPLQFGSHHYGKSAHELFRDLLNAVPDEEDSVVTHGDLCLPNILVDAERQEITGFVDVGDMGVSDRHLDLVLAAWSIQYNWGGKYINRFYELYDIDRDHAKFHFYHILNEFC